MWIRINQAFNIPTDVRAVLTTLYNAGFEAYLVGGSVRDWIRAQPIKDYDIATNAKPEEVEKLFTKVVDIGRAFGVMKVVTETDRHVEVATFRKESEYEDHRHPSKVTFSDVEADASRRDFTVNALYYDLKIGQVLDLFGGIDDLKKKVIRAIGNAELRFNEDALRLLRAVRFSARFAFSIDPDTRAAIATAAPLIRKVSIERICDEIEKMLTHINCRQALVELDTLGLLENVLPEIAVGKLEQKKVWDQTLRVLTNLSNHTEVEPLSFYWALIFLPTLRLHAIERRDVEAKQIAHRMKLSNEVADQMAYLVRETPKFKDAFSMREATLLRWMGEAHFELLMRFHELDAISYDGNLAGLEFVKTIYPEAKRSFHSKPLITGDDLVRLGMSPGRQFTEILRAVEDLALEGKLVDSEQALEYVVNHFVK
jgi:poly(A) polymerase